LNSPKLKSSTPKDKPTTPKDKTSSGVEEKTNTGAGTPTALKPLLDNQDYVRTAIVESFRKTERELIQLQTDKNREDGSVCISVLIVGNTLWIANLGDSKAVLSRLKDPTKPDKDKDSKVLCIRLSTDHQPVLSAEKTRIEKTGAMVIEGRVNGLLAVSRSFGDPKFKKLGVVAQPDISKVTLTTDCQFMVLACDGIWSVFAPAELVTFTAKAIDEQWEAEKAQKSVEGGVSALQKKESDLEAVTRKVTQKIVREAVIVRSAKDNCTVLLVIFGEHSIASHCTV